MNQPAEQIIDNNEVAPNSIEAAAQEATPALEENVTVELQQILDEYSPAYNPNEMPIDQLDNRYSINLNEPLPHLNSARAEAFRAYPIEESSKAYYALICSSDYPYRKRALERFENFKHPNIVQLKTAGTVRLSRGDHRFVFVFEEPMGKKLSEIIASGTRFHEKQVVEQILTPLISVLVAMNEIDVSHGRICPDNIYLGERVTIGECLSESSGYSQPYFYEPIERMLATPIGKGAANEKTDVYALTMLAYELMFGMKKFSGLSKDQFAEKLLESGSYNALTPHLSLSESLEDLFRGTLNETKQERWGLEQLDLWLKGKRFNLIHPSLPRESSRAFEFNDKEYFNRRSLAHALTYNWNLSCRELGPLRLDRWLEMSAHTPETAEDVAHLLPDGDHTKEIKSAYLCRIISIIDPTGPMRLKNLSTSIDGLGATLCDAYSESKNSDIESIRSLIKNDIPTFLGDIDPNPKPQDTAHTLWLLQRIRQYLDSRAVGFGIERLFYDLNGSLPCQSSMLKRYNVNDSLTMLHVLDFLSKDMGASNSLHDRHMAAFLTSKLELLKDQKITQLSNMPELATHPEIIIIKLLGQAQEKHKNLKLVGLSTWCALRVCEQLHYIHNRKLRREIRADLKSGAKTGRIAYVLGVLFNPQILKKDQQGFARATRLHQFNEHKIRRLKHEKAVQKVADELGGRTAVIIAYLILGVTSYFMLEQYMGW